MNNLKAKLVAEIAKQKAKDPATHKIAGYRQNGFTNAALANARARQKWAIDWREKACAADADSVRNVEVSNKFFSRRYKVFSKNGVDVLAVYPKGGSNLPDRLVESDRIVNGDFNQTMRDRYGIKTWAMSA